MAITTETPEKLTVSVAEASIISGFSRVVIRTAIKRGELKKPSATWLCSRSSHQEG